MRPAAEVAAEACAQWAADIRSRHTYKPMPYEAQERRVRDALERGESWMRDETLREALATLDAARARIAEMEAEAQHVREEALEAAARLIETEHYATPNLALARDVRSIDGDAGRPLAKRIAELETTLDVVRVRERQLHYAIRTTAPAIDSKFTEVEAHAKALDVARKMHDRIADLEARLKTADESYRRDTRHWKGVYVQAAGDRDAALARVRELEPLKAQWSARGEQHEAQVTETRRLLGVANERAERATRERDEAIAVYQRVGEDLQLAEERIASQSAQVDAARREGWDAGANAERDLVRLRIAEASQDAANRLDQARSASNGPECAFVGRERSLLRCCRAQ